MDDVLSKTHSSLIAFIFLTQGNEAYNPNYRVYVLYYELVSDVDRYNNNEVFQK